MVTFDGDNKIVQVDNGVTEIFVETDIYIAWKNWVLAGNTGYDQTMQKLGGETLVPNSIIMPIAYQFLNNWKLRPSEEQQILTVKSNLFSDDGTLPYVIPAGFEDLIIVNIEDGVCGVECPEPAGTSGHCPPCPDCPDCGTNGGDCPDCPDCGTNGNIGCGLDPGQDAKLTQIANQLDEVWRLMGLDRTAPVNITKTTRTTRDIDQEFDGDPTGNVTITRN